MPYNWSTSNTEYWYITVGVSDADDQLIDSYYEPEFELRFDSYAIAVLARTDLLLVTKGSGGLSNSLVVSPVLHNKPVPLDLKKYDEPETKKVTKLGQNRPRVKPDGTYWPEQEPCVTNDPI